MEINLTTYPQEAEIQELRRQLEEANDTIEAIRTGQVDALIVQNNNGTQLYTLKSADQTYRVFIEKMKEGAVTLNQNGLILYCNTKFAAMVNLPLSEVIGVLFNKFVPEEYKSYCNSLFNAGWQVESKGELGLLNNTAQHLPILLSLTTLELDEGIALSLIVTDLSAQKETENQLRLKNEQLEQAHNALTQLNNELEYRVGKRTYELSLSRENFKFLADNIPVIVWTGNPEGGMDYFNKRWFEYTGATFDDTRGGGWQTFIHQDDLQQTLDAWTHSLKTGDDFNVEYRFKRVSDSTYRWHSGMAVPFRDPKAKIIAWFGISTDIEDQKVALTKKDEFISMASHELKTPITTLKAITQMLLYTFEEEHNTQAVDYLNRMNRQINKLTGLVSDLLEATKVNAGEMQLTNSVFNLNDLISEVVETLQLTLPTHIIRLQLSEAVNVNGDRNRLAQVMDNLISNAVKYSPKADKIIVGTEIIANKVRFFVQDFGIGIPVSQQSQLFNRFFRASEVKSNSFPGLGLGLYISHEIITKHSGIFTFTSTEGEGSTFSFELDIVG